jgi:hypothetical protein
MHIMDHRTTLTMLATLIATKDKMGHHAALQPVDTLDVEARRVQKRLVVAKM